MHQDAPRAGDADDLADRLDRPHLVVGMHDAHQDGSFRDGVFESLHVDDPLRIDGHIGDIESFGGQVLADLRHGGMFEGRGNDVISPAAMRPCSTLDGMVVRFRPAAREEDLGGSASEQSRHLSAGLLDALAGLNTVFVAARGVAEMLPDVGEHGRGNLGADGRSGVVIQVDGFHRNHGFRVQVHRMNCRAGSFLQLFTQTTLRHLDTSLTAAPRPCLCGL